MWQSICCFFEKQLLLWALVVIEEDKMGPTEKGKGERMQKQETWEEQAKDPRLIVTG